MRTGFACQVTLGEWSVYVDDCAHSFGVTGGRRIAHMALQYRLGLLSQRWIGTSRGYRACSRTDRSNLAELQKGDGSAIVKVEVTAEAFFLTVAAYLLASTPHGSLTGSNRLRDLVSRSSNALRIWSTRSANFLELGSASAAAQRSRQSF
jgi:hypothetical protein